MSIILIQLFSVVILHSLSGNVEGFKQNMFMRRNDCLDKVIKPEFRYISTAAQTATQCTQACLTDVNCGFLSFSASQCHMSSLVVDGSCSLTEQNNGGVIYEKKPVPINCQNGGTEHNGTCICPRCFAGVECQRPLFDCSEAEGDSLYTGWEGVCTIQPDAYAPLQVFCSYKTPKARTYIQRHYSAGNFFEKNWIDYKLGFGTVDSHEFWIGNEILYRMTLARSYDFVVQMALSGWTQFYAQAYHEFQVFDESTNYTMVYQSTSGNLGDSLFHVNNTQFSTPDMDNDDEQTINCAQTRKCGFWFRGTQCGYGNPNGIIQETPDGFLANVPEEVIWTYDRGDWSPWNIQIWLQR